MSWRTTLAAFAVWALLFGMTGLSVGYGVMTAVSCAFTTIVLVMTMLTADASGWAAVWVLFIPYGLIGTVNIDLEGIFFDIFPLTAGLRLLSGIDDKTRMGNKEIRFGTETTRCR